MSGSSGTLPPTTCSSGGQLLGGARLPVAAGPPKCSGVGVLVTDLRRGVEEFYAGFTAGDFDRAFRIFAEDVVTVEPFLGRSATLAEWRAYDEAFKVACPDASFVLHSTVEQGDRIAAEGSFRGSFTAPLRTPQRELQPTGCSFDVAFRRLLPLPRGQSRGAQGLLRPGRLRSPARDHPTDPMTRAAMHTGLISAGSVWEAVPGASAENRWITRGRRLR